jgi:phospholipid/cholesterol/gamma-HCH transport system ATP-binding protein
MQGPTEPIISVRHLCYQIGGQQILRDLSLDVYPGEIFGVMGMSGTGKSTLLKTLMGLLPLCGGDILIEGRSIVDLSELELMEVRERMGMCFQYAALFDSMTVGDNVAFGLRRRGKRTEAEVQRLVSEHLEDVGLEGLERKMPSELSGGMRKRVGIARAVALRPDILLYDEPSAGLDPIMSAVIDRLIVEVRDKYGVTSVVVTHDVNELFRISNRVMMLHQGEAVACDTPERLRGTDNAVVQQFVHGEAEGPIVV